LWRGDSYWIAHDDREPGCLPEGIVLAPDHEQKERFLGPFFSLIVHAGEFALTEPGGGSVPELQDRARATESIGCDRREVLYRHASAPIGSFAGQCGAGEGPFWSAVRFSSSRNCGACGFKIERSGLKAYESTSFTLEECEFRENNLLARRRARRNRHL